MTDQVKRETLKEKFLNIRAEFKKIIWPNRVELAKKTLVVIVTSLLMGVLIAGIDSVYGALYELAFRLLGK